jgi:hypothetical protein
MGFCPNCGSWVEEGDTCNFCGGSGTRNNTANDYVAGTSGGFRKPSKRYVPVANIRSSIKNNRFLNNEIWDGASSEVLDALNRYDDYNEVSQTIHALNDLINIELGRQKFYRMRLDAYKRICVEFLKEDKYINIVTGKPFGGSCFDVLDEYEYYLDDRIRDIPEFVELVMQMESDGFEYRGITMYMSYNPGMVYLKFAKEEYHFKTYIFDIEKRTCELLSEYSHPCKLMHTSKNPPEKGLLLDEIKRVEAEDNCHRAGCSGDIFRFESENLDGKYGFLCPY